MSRQIALSFAILLAAGCSRNSATGSKGAGSGSTSVAGTATATIGASGTSGGPGSASAGAAGSTSGNANATNSGTNGNGSAASAGSVGSNGSPGSNGSSAALGSSGSSGSTGATCPPNLTAMQLSPASTTEAIQNGQASPITFTITGSSGSSIDPSLLQWTVSRADDTNPGSISNGVFTPFTGAGGVITITATGCGATATATVILTLNYQVQGGGADGGTGISNSDFNGTPTTSATLSPIIVYPSDQTRFPRNVYKILFQWRPSGSSLFRVTFTGPGSTVQVFTDGTDPACAGIANAACWQADLATWTAIAGSNAGATVDVVIDGTSGAGQPVYSSAHETLGFSRRDVKGAIFYWAANVGGVERATVSDSAPENYLVGPQVVAPTTFANGDTVQCAACHTFSRDGTKMAVSGQAQGPVPMGHGLWTLQVTPSPPPIPIQTMFPQASGDGFSAFSPDTSKLIWSARNGGTLVLVDSTSGALITDVTVGGNPVTGTAPDWSPDTTTNFMAYEDAESGISQISWDGTTFTTPQQLAPKIGGNSNGYPSYSPAGDWVAFTNNNTTLYIVPSTGGPSVKLAAANGAGVDAGGGGPGPGPGPGGPGGKSENSMPTWAPPGDLNWVAFNSQRPYGLVAQGGTNQLWVAAVDFARLDGGDPSYPGFWLPFQDLTSKNHRAYWTLDIRDQDAGPVDAGAADAGPGPEKDAGPPADAGPADAGPPDAGVSVYDAGPCVATGDACDPNGAGCCDQLTTGAYCGSDPDGGSSCQNVTFR